MTGTFSALPRDVLAALRAVLGSEPAPPTATATIAAGVARVMPLAGLAAGAIAMPVLVGAAVTLPQPVPVILAYATIVALTRARSERALAAVADGLGLAAGSNDRGLSAGAIGSAGAMALMLVLALKLSALAALDFSAAAGAILAASAASRIVHVLVLRCSDATAATRPCAADIALSLALGLTPGMAFLSPATWLYGLALRRRRDGVGRLCPGMGVRGCETQSRRRPRTGV